MPKGVLPGERMPLDSPSGKPLCLAMPVSIRRVTGLDFVGDVVGIASPRIILLGRNGARITVCIQVMWRGLS